MKRGLTRRIQVLPPTLLVPPTLTTLTLLHQRSNPEDWARFASVLFLWLSLPLWNCPAHV